MSPRLCQSPNQVSSSGRAHRVLLQPRRSPHADSQRWEPSLLLVLMAATIPILFAARIMPSWGALGDRVLTFLYLPLSALFADGAVRWSRGLSAVERGAAEPTQALSSSGTSARHGRVRRRSSDGQRTGLGTVDQALSCFCRWSIDGCRDIGRSPLGGRWVTGWQQGRRGPGEFGPAVSSSRRVAGERCRQDVHAGILFRRQVGHGRVKNCPPPPPSVPVCRSPVHRPNCHGSAPTFTKARPRGRSDSPEVN